MAAETAVADMVRRGVAVIVATRDEGLRPERLTVPIDVAGRSDGAPGAGAPP